MTSSPARPTAALPREAIAAELPPLSLGSWHIFDRIRFDDGVDLVETALEVGIRHFDIGVYDRMEPGFTDIIFGAILRAVGVGRDDYLLSSKLWLTRGGPETLRPQLERALLRLDTGHADLIVFGDLPAESKPAVEDLVEAVAGLLDAGLTRAWAVNNWPAATLARMTRLAGEAGVPGPVFAQLKYSVARRAVADGEPFAELFADGLRLEASDVLEGGILAGRRDRDRAIGKDPGDVRARILEQLDDFLGLAERIGAPPAELAMAFAMSHPAVVTTLFGATRPEQLHAAVRARTLLAELGAAEVRRLVEPFWADRGVVDPAG